jgi:acetolactate synthase I/II/III large subunit
VRGAHLDIAEAIAEELRAAGAQFVFGVPGGGSNLELVGACGDRGIEFVLAHTETAAAIMAATVGELTAKPAGCVVTRGPGAAAAVNGTAHALLDRAPLLLVADALTVADAERVSHQRLDQGRLFAEVVKASVPIGAANPRATARQAIALACADPPGAVHLDVVADAPAGREGPLVTGPGPPDPAAIARAESVLRRARRPIVLVGLGARGEAGAVRELVRDTSVPVLTTYKAKGVVPESSPNAAGLLTGATVEASLLESADAILALGLDPVELIPGPWPYRAPVLSICPWPVTDPYFDAVSEIVAPLGGVLPALRRSLRADWSTEAQAARRSLLEGLDVEVAGLGPQDVVRIARDRCPPGTVATVDSGAHMFVGTAYWQVEEPGEALISSGLATMGYALPAAIGAALVSGRRTVCLTGDGGLGMCLSELETLARLDLPVTVVVFNDSALSLIEIKQRAEGQGGTAAVRYRPCDFAAVAEGLGVRASRVEREDELVAALNLGLRGDAPAVVDAIIDPSGYRSIMEAIREPRSATTASLPAR